MTNVNRKRSAVAIVGSMNMDLAVTTNSLPSPGETVVGSSIVQSPGGKGANQAVAASLLGAKVSLIAMTGDDNFGKVLVDSALSAGVDVSLVHTDYRAKTGTAIITVDAEAENTIVISPGANEALMPSLVRASLLKADDLAVVSACLEVPIETVTEALRSGREFGATTVLNLSPFDRKSAGLVALSDILIVNQHELSELLQMRVEDTDWIQIKKELKAMSAKVVLVTLGSDGCVILDCNNSDSEIVKIDAHKVEAVDTTGCGDAFAGAICSELAAGSNIFEAAKFASRVASYAAKSFGAQNSYGTRAQVLSS